VGVRHPLVGPVAAVDLYRHTMPVCQPPKTASYIVYKIGDTYYAEDTARGVVEGFGGDLHAAIQHAVDGIRLWGTVRLKLGLGYLDDTVLVDGRMLRLRGDHWCKPDLRPTGNFPAVKLKDTVWGTFIHDIGLTVDDALVPTYTSFLIDTETQATFTHLYRVNFAKVRGARLLGSYNHVFNCLFDGAMDGVVFKAMSTRSVAYNSVYECFFRVLDGMYCVKFEGNAGYGNAYNLVHDNWLWRQPGNTDARGVKLDGAEGTVENTRIYNNYLGYLAIGVEEAGTVTENEVYDNRFWGVSTPVSPITAKCYRNVGYATEASGTATIPAGATSVTVAHGLVKTPNKVIATARDVGVGAVACTARDATNITLTCETPPAADVVVDWYAEV